MYYIKTTSAKGCNNQSFVENASYVIYVILD